MVAKCDRSKVQFSLEQTELLVKTVSGPRQKVRVTVQNDGQCVPFVGSVSVGRKQVEFSWDLTAGTSVHFVDIAPLSSPARVALRQRESKAILASKVLKPVKPWLVHVVMHAHTDLGYTHPQREVFDFHYEFVKEAMRLVDSTKDYPEDARFKWLMEVMWQLEHFHDRAGKREFDRLLRLLKTGRMEVGGCFLNMTDIQDTEQVIRSFYPARRFVERYDIPLTTGLHCDVNGIPWIYPKLLTELGVKMLVMAINTDNTLAPFKLGMPFDWIGHDRTKILTWNGFIYAMGTVMRLFDGVDRAQNTLDEFLVQVGRKHFRPDPYGGEILPVEQWARTPGAGRPFETMIQSSCSYGDNSPPNLDVCDTIREWNERFIWPRLRTATMAEWYERVVDLRTGKQVLRGHWPDAWAYGMGHAVREISLARQTQSYQAFGQLAESLRQAGGAEGDGIAGRIERNYKQSVLTNEHTFGAGECVVDPYDTNSRIQWIAKSNMFHDTYSESRLVTESALAALAGSRQNYKEKTIAVINSDAKNRTGLATSRIAWADDYLLERGARLIDETNSREVEYTVRKEFGGSLIEFVARDVPAAGYKHYRLTIAEGSRAEPEECKWYKCEGMSLGNDYYNLELDSATGGLSGLVDLATGRQWVGKAGDDTFNSWIHERIADKPMHLWQSRLKPVDGKYLPESRRPHGRRCFARKRSRLVKLGPVVSTNEWAERSVTLQIPQLGKAVSKYRLYRRFKRIDITNSIDFHEDPRPEALYFAFPFAGRKTRLQMEVPGGLIDPEKDLLPGVCYDYYTVTGGLRISDENCALAMASLDAPMFMFNDLTMRAYQKRVPRFNGRVYSFAANNYWFTNFPATQAGQLAFRYSLTSGTGRSCSDQSAIAFARSVQRPVVGHYPMTPTERITANDSQGSLMSVSGSLQLLTIKPKESRDGWIVRLVESAGKPGVAKIKWYSTLGKVWYRCDSFERLQDKLGSTKRELRLHAKSNEVITLAVMR